MKTILFICIGNSCRSQMAEALCRTMFSDRFEPYSAGISPEPVRLLTIQVMEESGIDIQSAKEKSINIFSESNFDIVVTLCDKAREQLPFIPKAQQYFHTHITDPANAVGNEIEEYRIARASIENVLSEWLADNY